MPRFLVVSSVCLTLLAATAAQQSQPIGSSVQAALDEWRASVQAPGASLGIVRKDGTIVGLASGVSNRTSGARMTADDLLMTGSAGKTFFAAVALELIEKGQLDLSAPISKYLGTQPWFSRLPNAKDVTVRHLMTHTSGIVRYELNPKFTADLRAQPDKVWTPVEQLSYLFDSTPPFAAGEGWEYSDTNYIVLGMIMESIVGRKLYDVVQQRFLGPLKIGGVVPTTSRKIPGLAVGYAGAKDPLGLPDEVVKDGLFVINPQFEWTGGGYATSARSLARWGDALYTAKAVSPAMRDLMIAEGVPARLGPETKYGLGVIVRQTPMGTAWGHSGFFPGYQTELLHFPDMQLTLALQINSSGPRPPGTRSLLRFLYDLVGLLKS